MSKKYTNRNVFKFSSFLLIASIFVHSACRADTFLDPVVVTGAKVEQKLSDVLPSVTTITREEIERSQSTSMGELLQGEPGFEMSSTGGPFAQTSFYLRGEGSKSLVIFVDGVMSPVDGYADPTILNIPLATVDHIEILRGNSSAIYGEGAIGGVINIFTRQGSTSDPKAYGSISLGSRREQDLTTGYGGVVNDTKFNMIFSETGGDGYSGINPSQFSQSNPNNGGYKNESLGGNISKKLNADLEFGGGLKYLTNNVSIADSGAGQYDDSTPSNTFRQKSLSGDANIFAKYSVNPYWLSRLDLSDSQYVLKYYSDLADALALQISNYQTTVSQASAKWFNTYQLTNFQNIFFGIDANKSIYQDGFGDTMYRNSVAYLTGYNQRISNVDVQLNMRHDSLNVQEPVSGIGEQNFGANSGLVGLGYFFTDSFKLTASTSSGFRAPSAGEIFGFSGGGPTGSTFNPGLKPEMHYSDEFGFTWAQRFTSTRVVYFNSRTSNAIEGVFSGLQSEYVNVAQAKNHGMEFSERANFLGYKVVGAYTLQNPNDFSSATPIVRQSKEFGSLDVDKSINDFDVGSKVVFAGSRLDYDYTYNGTNKPDKTLPAYQVWSFYGGYKLNSEWNARIKLSNAFNQNYQLVYGYNSAPRSLILTFNYSQK